MALYGSASANLSPILFKGNLFREGVNIIMHSDVSLSMSVPSPVSAASTNYTMAPRPFDGTSASFAANYRNSPFYDGVFPTFLQKELIKRKVGESSKSPNLFGYFDSAPRSISNPPLSSSQKQTIIQNTESYTFSDSVFIASGSSSIGNLTNDRVFYDFWKTRYVDSPLTNFTDSYPFNIAAFNGRLDGNNNTRSDISTYDSNQDRTSSKLSYYSEDVHGNIISLYYSGTAPISNATKTTGSEITAGDITQSLFGSDLYKIPRRNLPTYFITASNEQENAAPDAISVSYNTTSNVGYSTDKYQYKKLGLFARRYRGCIGALVWNQNCTLTTSGSTPTYNSERYRSWIESYAVPLPFGSTTTGLAEDAPGINWFNDGLVYTPDASITNFSIYSNYIQGTPQLPYYTKVGSNYQVDSSLSTNVDFTDIEIPNAFVPSHLQALTSYDVNFNPAASGGAASIKQSVTNRNKIGGFWGPINSLDRVRSDIQNYTIMMVGYFKPPESGYYKFKLMSAGVCVLWISSDERVDNSGNPLTNLSDSYVYKDWDAVSEATLACPPSATDRFRFLNPLTTGSEASRIAAYKLVAGDGTDATSGGVVANVETNGFLRMTKDRYYAMRIILSNPGNTQTFNVDNNSFSVPNSSDQISCDTSSFGSSVNPSFFRLFVSDPRTSPSSTPIGKDEWNLNSINGAPVFYGADDVWKYGSPFFPLPTSSITKTIKEEINERNIRVISLSSYNSDDSYDGVFFFNKPDKPGDPPTTKTYRYIKLTTDDYYKDDLTTAPSTWRFGNYFKPLSFSIDESKYTKIQNPSTLTPTIGTGAVLNVTKLNDRYLTVPQSGGVGFKTGDRIKIESENIGSTSSANINDLLLSVSNVQSEVYTDRAGSLEGSTRTNLPSFFISKNADQTGSVEYTVTINPDDAGSGYSIGDRLTISGTSLDGNTPAHDVNILVTNVSGGSITDISPSGANYGSPTEIIGYEVTLDTFDPISYSSINYPIKNCNIGYRYQNITGLAYTTANIIGISYTTYPIVGAAYSTFNITGIAYTTASIVSIGYSTANISGIAYTTRNAVSIGYSAANITGIAYTAAKIVSIGYSSASVTAIGYTSPQVVSIGYTAVQVNSISYPDAITISQITDVNGSDPDLILTLSNSPSVSTILNVGDFVIISNTGNSAIDGRRIVTSVSDPDTITITPGAGIGANDNVLINPIDAKLIVESGPIGYGSTAVLTTNANHPFNAGDSIIIRGVKKPQYTGWNSTFVVKEVIDLTSLTLENTGTVGLFTATSLGQEVGAGLTVGYDQSELQLEIATPVPYQFEVGMGITVFGVTGESSIYNNGYVIRSILESDGSGPYKFDLLQNQTPTQLALAGNTGRVGIHTISGIATVSSTSSFGIPGDSINLKIENSPSSFFNKIFNGAIILDDTRILLGSDSHRNSTTPTPQEYVSINANASTLSGRIGSQLKIEYSDLTSGYTFNIGNEIDVYGVSPTSVYDTVGYFYTIQSISGSTLFVNATAGINTSFSLVGTAGSIGVRNLNPILTVSTISGLSTNFGSIDQSVIISIKNSNKLLLNNNTTNAKIIGTNKFLLSGFENPKDFGENYNSVGSGGTIGLINSNLRVITSTPHEFNVNNSIRIQNANATYNGTYTISRIINANTFDLSTLSSSTTDFGIVATSGLVGLRADGVVTTSSSHPFVTGNSVKIQNTGNSDFDGNNYIITRIDATKFILNSTSTGNYTDDFTTSGASSGIAGLINYPATVTTSSPHPFVTGQKVAIQNVSNTYGASNNRYTVTNIDSTTFKLDINATGITDISLKDTSGLIGLLDAKPIVTYETNHKYIDTDLKLNNGDRIKIQNTSLSHFDNRVFTVSLIQNGDPNGTLLITGNNIENSSSNLATPIFTSYNGTLSAIGGLIDSKLRIKTGSNHNLTGGSIRIEGTSFFDGNSAISAITSNTLDLENSEYISDEFTDFTLFETSPSVGVIGPHGFPAIATFSFSSSLPSSFATNSSIKIEGTTTYLTSPSNKVYTITRYDNQRLALQESVIGDSYPTSIRYVENDASLYAGLKNSPARINVTSTSDFGPVGKLVRVNISGISNSFFNGTQDARITSSTTMDLIEKTNPDSQIPSINYKLTGINFLGISTVGLANSSRVVTVSGGHNLGTINELNLNAQIYIRSTSVPSYDGQFVIKEILDSNRFTIDPPSGTTQNPTNYILSSTGYYIGINSGARITTNSNHLLNVGDTITIDDNENDFDGSFTVRTIYSPTSFSLNNTYPSTSGGNVSPFNVSQSSFDFTRSTVSGRILPQRPISSHARIKVFRTLSNGYELPYGSPANLNNVLIQNASGYRKGQRFIIKGGKLGGQNGTNDLFVTIGSIDISSGSLIYNSLDPDQNTLLSASGTPDITLDYSIDGIPIPIESSDTASTGTNARFTVVRSGLRTIAGIPTYTSVTRTNSGSNYLLNDVIIIPGDTLGGPLGSKVNDLYIKVTSLGSGGSINGIAFTGIASDSYAISGFTTIYNDGIQNLSRPFGLEQNWDHSLDGSPPSQGAYLQQTQDVLTLAAENYGGVIKIDKVYNTGSPQKTVAITSCFFYGYTWHNTAAPSSVIFDQSNSGIATIFMDDDSTDGLAFRFIQNEEEIYVFNSNSPYLDYTSVGYAHTVVSVFSQLNARDSLIVNTTNYNFTSSDNKSNLLNLNIIRKNSPLTISAYSHGFSNGDEVTLYLTQNSIGIPYETKSGLGYTTYIVQNALPNSFQVVDMNLNPITAGSILNGQDKPLIEYFYKSLRPISNIGINGEQLNVVTGTGDITDNGNKTPYGLFVVAEKGTAYVVGVGVTPVDNRIGLAKAISDFMYDIASTKN